MTNIPAAVAEHWPFLLTALIVGGWVVYDIARTETHELPKPKESTEEEVSDSAMSRHSLDDDEPDKVPALEILEREGERGHPLRLNWTDDDTDPYGYAFHRDRGDWPTAVIPVVKDDWF